ncbi:MAG: MFS transporter [Flavobacteriaceae bacterium]|nr:MFS transporter [Eudoraea sp.]MBT8285678.1 MFS transporter [Muriicola sp.]NNK12231.1 MFS transporter [Flavobacteriaceae bacterium]MBT8290927.1 MFS transporter [Muriicola sp.]NNC62212.1 MFS transporter [Eudoraea sp.]
MLLQELLNKSFNIREGEFKISFLMQLYVFLIITSLLIIKPTVNSLFLSELGVENLPVAFLLIAVVAYFSSYFYSKALARLSLRKVIETTLGITIVILATLTVLLKMNLLNAWMLYVFYVWVAIHAVLSASQFWVLANLVFNPREAKRLFGFIGAGAILGGIFGGYLTSILAPVIGNDNIFFLAIGLLVLCIPLLNKIWRLRVINLNKFKAQKRKLRDGDNPLWLIRNSKHLSYLASILGISVLVAKLVDYQFSDFASAAILDPDDLTAFFAFWFSTFNLLSLGIQLFITHRVVGVWGVGISMLLLPLGILAGCLLFLVFPELAIIIFIKAVDGSFKQSVNKSAMELLALPLSFDLKNKTKSYIDVVIDSFATGIAGFILIFLVRGLELPSLYITGIIIILLIVWIYFIYKVRGEYFQTFRDNLSMALRPNEKAKKINPKKRSILNGMKKVFDEGTEAQILFMLGKLREINDNRFMPEVQELLKHPSNKVKTAAIQNFYFLNNTSLTTEVSQLLSSGDEELITATLDYLLLHASEDRGIVFDNYLEHNDPVISRAALFCLAKEARDNPTLHHHYALKERIAQSIQSEREKGANFLYAPTMMNTIGAANIPEFYPVLSQALKSRDENHQRAAIRAIGLSIHPHFLPELLPFLSNKSLRVHVTEALIPYGPQLVPYLIDVIHNRTISLQLCRLIPGVFRSIPSQSAVNALMGLLEDPDLTIRQEAIRSLSDIKKNHPEIRFDHLKVVRKILEECKMYHQTLSAMHSQIIISFRNRTKSRQLVSDEEREARTSLLEILERRLDAGLERIFKLLGLKYSPNEIEIAYEGILSDQHDAQTRAIEYLDNLLYGDLKRKLLPIIEESSLDITSEEVQQRLISKVPSEYECFQILLGSYDHKLKLAVLYLIRKQRNPKYVPLVEQILTTGDERVVEFARKTLEHLRSI